MTVKILSRSRTIHLTTLFALIFYCSSVHALRTEAFWSDSTYWVKVNNSQSISPLRQKDFDTLGQVELDGGALMSTHYSVSGESIPQTVAAWSYLAEMGMAILRNDNPVEAEAFLTATQNTTRFYNEMLFRGVSGIYGQGRYVNKAGILTTQTGSTLAAETSLPFNFNTSIAYFCAVRNDIHKKFRGTESFADVSTAFHIYQYLHTQMEKFTYEGQARYVKWKYGEHRADGTADDFSHAGLAARSIAYGAKSNFVWRWWANALFIYQAPEILRLKPLYMNFTGVADPNASGFIYWELPYPN